MQPGLECNIPDDEFNKTLFVLSRYLETCYRVARLEQPTDLSVAWGEVCMLADLGHVSTLQAWAVQVGINVNVEYIPKGSEEQNLAMMRELAAKGDVNMELKESIDA